MFGKNKDPVSQDEKDRYKDFDEFDWENRDIRMTWAVQHVDGFLKDINPTYMMRMKENARAMAQREANTTDYFKWTIILVMIMFGGALAYYIISQGGGGGVAQAAKSAGSAVSGTSIN